MDEKEKELKEKENLTKPHSPPDYNEFYQELIEEQQEMNGRL